jgi:hypothetical protein
VHLANKKAAWQHFVGFYQAAAAAQQGKQVPIRSKDIVDTPANPDARKALVIDPGSRPIAGPGVSGDDHRFDGGTLLGTPVPLEELRTDAAGRHLCSEDSDTPNRSNPTTPSDTTLTTTIGTRMRRIGL